MTNIYVVCGAGASSTFLALRLRNLSKHLSDDLVFLPAALETLRPKEGEIIAAASHVSSEPILEEFEQSGVTVLRLPNSPINDELASKALNLIEKILVGEPNENHTTQRSNN
jgi:cellobiose-specific phosphotransferase system component IIB